LIGVFSFQTFRQGTDFQIQFTDTIDRKKPLSIFLIRRGISVDEERQGNGGQNQGGGDEETGAASGAKTNTNEN
jgi:hypothetical protein